MVNFVANIERFVAYFGLYTMKPIPDFILVLLIFGQGLDYSQSMKRIDMIGVYESIKVKVDAISIDTIRMGERFQLNH